MNLSNKVVCFLDIDGVLNGEDNLEDTQFNPESVEVLNWMNDEWGIQLVLSSSWRSSYTMKYISELFKQNGVKAELIDKTPEYVGRYVDNTVSLANISENEFNSRIYPNAGRNAEIMHYIRRYQIYQFIILDDSLLSNVYLHNHQLQTKSFGENSGLRWSYKNKIKDIINIVDYFNLEGETIN